MAEMVKTVDIVTLVVHSIPTRPSDILPYYGRLVLQMYMTRLCPIPPSVNVPKTLFPKQSYSCTPWWLTTFKHIGHLFLWTISKKEERHRE